MDKIFDIFIGRLDGYHTVRVAQHQTVSDVDAWLAKGYKIQTEHQIGARLYQVYLIPA